MQHASSTRLSHTHVKAMLTLMNHDSSTAWSYSQIHKRDTTAACNIHVGNGETCQHAMPESAAQCKQQDLHNVLGTEQSGVRPHTLFTRTLLCFKHCQ